MPKINKNRELLRNKFGTFLLIHRAQLIIIVVGLIVLFIRRPDIILSPQFWAEDATIWYQTAFNHHFSLLTLVTPYAGYLGLFPRTVALISGIIKINDVPLFFNIIALFVQIIPLIYLWSKRFSYYITDYKYKIILTIIYLTLPYSAEIHGNITNSQWYLALISFIIVFLPSAKNRIPKWIDYILLGISSLSGPFSIMLSLVILIDPALNKCKRQKIELEKKIIVFTAAITQITVLLISPRLPHNISTIGFSVTQFFVILGGQIYGGVLFGYKSLPTLLDKPWITTVIAILGTELMIYIIVKAPRILRMLIIYSTLVFFAALISPNGLLTGLNWWQTLSTVQSGGRYYYFLHLSFVVGITWTIFVNYKRNRVLSYIVSTLLLCLILIGIPSDMRYYQFPDKDYQYYIKNYESLNNGAKIVIPINPGGSWHLTLVKR
jgi:hypothetical protein